MTKEINHGGSKNKLHSMHVFLLDDNPSSCSMIGGMIALNVANVTMCRCIQEAYKILSNTSPDIIISRYFLADDLLATYFFRELKYRNIYDRKQVNICLVSETESYKEDSLDFFIDNTIITPCSPDSLRAGLAIAV